MAKVIHHGPAKPDDPICSTGLVNGGRRLHNSRSGTSDSAKVGNRDDLLLRRWAKLLEAEAIEAIENPGD